MTNEGYPESVSESYRRAVEARRSGYDTAVRELEAAMRRAIEVEERSMLAALEPLLDGPARARAEEFGRRLDEVRGPALAAAPEAPTIEDLGVDDLHRLARLDSTLRHSVVEDCLMNLRTLAGALEEKGHDEALEEAVAKQVALLPGVMKQVVDFFSKPLVLGISIKDLLPATYRLALGATRGLLWIVEKVTRRKAKPAGIDGRELSKRIDDLTEALTGLRRHLDERRVPLAQVAERAARAVAPGTAIDIEDESDGGARLFLDGAAVENAVGESLRNALKYGRPPIRVVVTEEPPPSTEVRLSVTDAGPGFPLEVLARFGERGLSTTGGGEGLSLLVAAAAIHHGRVEAENLPGGGARVSLVLPRRPKL
jgi:signal transduction histidine kinase